MIYVTRTYSSKVSTPKTKMVRTFKKCNLDLLSRDLEEVPWGVMDVFDTFDEKWLHWKSLFLSILDSHTPLIKVRPRQAQSQWISNEIRAQMKSRNYYMKKYRKTRDPLDWEQYRQLLLSSLKLNTRKATGADCISSHLLRSLAPVLIPSISKFFNHSLSIGEVPNGRRLTSPLSRRNPESTSPTID